MVGSGCPPLLQRSFPVPTRYKHAFITSSKAVSMNRLTTGTRQAASHCQLTPPLHTSAAQLFPFLATSVPPWAACFSHGCATKLAPPRTASNMHSMPASSYAQNPAREARLAARAPAFSSSSLATFLSLAMSPAALPPFPDPPTWSQVPTLRRPRNTEPAKEKPATALHPATKSQISGYRRPTHIHSRSLFGPGATPSFSLLVCASAPRPQEGPLCAHASR